MRSRAWSLLLLAAPLLCGCANGGRFSLLGYSTAPNYDEKYRTVYVPIFQNQAFQSGPLRGLEYQLTEAVQKQIESVTPYKVTADRELADTELLCTIVQTPTAVINRNQLNEIREGIVSVYIELVWRDLRTGEILSKSRAGGGGQPLVLAPGQPPPPVVIRATGRFIPELGESQTTALHQASRQMAVQIVSLMEQPWGNPND